MALEFHIDIVSAEQQLFSGTAYKLIAPALMGDVGILARHTPILTPLRSGLVVVHKQDTEHHFYITGGLLEVQPHIVTILADSGQRSEELDMAKALEAKQRVERKMSRENLTPDECQKLQAELEQTARLLRAIEQIRIRSKKIAK